MTSFSLRVSAVITGTSGGLGRNVALGFADKDYFVIGSAASTTKGEDLRWVSNGSVGLTVCDITSGHAGYACASDVSDALGERDLDFLISNAGILTSESLAGMLDAGRHGFKAYMFGALDNLMWLYWLEGPYT